MCEPQRVKCLRYLLWCYPPPRAVVEEEEGEGELKRSVELAGRCWLNTFGASLPRS